MINPLSFAKRVSPATLLRPLGSFEHFFWLIDQNRPIHFALAAHVQGATEIKHWREALELVQRRHPLLSASIVANGTGSPYFRQEVVTPIPLRVRKENNATRDSELSLQ